MSAITLEQAQAVFSIIKIPQKSKVAYSAYSGETCHPIRAKVYHFSKQKQFQYILNQVAGFIQHSLLKLFSWNPLPLNLW
jgi:hypothetical protein